MKIIKKTFTNLKAFVGGIWNIGKKYKFGVFPLKEFDYKKLNPTQYFIIKDEEKLKIKAAENAARAKLRSIKRADDKEKLVKIRAEKEKIRAIKKAEAEEKRKGKEENRIYLVEKVRVRVKEETDTAKRVTDEKVQAIKTYMDNAYIRGRAAWNDIYGSAIQRTVNLRRLNLILSMIILICIFGLIHIGSQSKIQPYIVRVDGNGAVLSVDSAEKAPDITDKLVAYTLSQFVINLRSISADNVVEKDRMNKVYATIDTNEHGNALNMVRNYISQNSPFNLNSKMTNQVEIISVLKESDQSYQISWNETKRSLNGDILNQSRYIAHLTYAIEPVNSARIKNNPFGVYVTNLTWSNEL